MRRRAVKEITNGWGRCEWGRFAEWTNLHENPTNVDECSPNLPEIPTNMPDEPPEIILGRFVHSANLPGQKNTR